MDIRQLTDVDSDIAGYRTTDGKVFKTLELALAHVKEMEAG